MAVNNSRILSTKQLVQLIKESNENGTRFCFILGSGASVESGIPSGNTLEMQWMEQLMDDEKAADDIRKTAGYLFEEQLIKHSIEEIENAWKEAKKTGKSISSIYYFDIYKLRFYPDRRNGYRYLERIMERCEPSLGYHILAKLMTRDNLNNLVITTNFDSLVEDALFLYTDKKPLVVSHESLAGYIDSNVQRPIIAKVHRDLMYAPFNSPETTSELKEEWREALNDAFKIYTPIVIGYAGGDRSLMAFLEESTAMRNGVYWCYRESPNLPEDGIQKFVEDKNGYFVTINGFDALMMELGDSLYKDEITPSGTKKYLEEQYGNRVRRYNTQWDELNKKQEMKKVLQTMNEVEHIEEKKREEEKKLTAWDYGRRGNRAYDEGQYQKAVEEYTEAINLDPNYVVVYSNRGSSYSELGKHEEAIKDCTKAIELDPNYAAAYINRGSAYDHLGQHEKAIVEYAKAIELDPNQAVAYNNRGFAYDHMGQYEKAIEDYMKAVELDPNYITAYNNRGCTYDHMGQYGKAIEDYTKAIELKPDYARAYCNRGSAHNSLGEHKSAVEDCTKAIELEPNNITAYNNRGCAYSHLKQHENAVQDFTKAIELNPNYFEAYNNRASSYDCLGQYENAINDCTKAIELNSECSTTYYFRGFAYDGLQQYEKAIDDFTKAVEKDAQYKNAYLGRAKAYRAIGEEVLAKADEEYLKKI